jgi:hypothetical protein
MKQPDGMFYPMDQIEKDEQFLQGFSWNPALRPKTWQEVAEIEEPVVVPGPPDEPGKTVPDPEK